MNRTDDETGGKEIPLQQMRLGAQPRRESSDILPAVRQTVRAGRSRLTTLQAPLRFPKSGRGAFPVISDKEKTQYGRIV